ncbi:unnamed protein product, partial [Mesorhabditis belari]|uniref:UPAR/Ly6 domain-containing protein n=1 Tax=Mesorhabditis belari TaxID=2138241 RepID=A0AAF3FLZ6_9BILA
MLIISIIITIITTKRIPDMKESTIVPIAISARKLRQSLMMYGARHGVVDVGRGIRFTIAGEDIWCCSGDLCNSSSTTALLLSSILTLVVAWQ